VIDKKRFVDKSRFLSDRNGLAFPAAFKGKKK
jgi:hypothetical protein